MLLLFLNAFGVRLAKSTMDSFPVLGERKMLWIDEVSIDREPQPIPSKRHEKKLQPFAQTHPSIRPSNWPKLTISPAHTGKGYATEALRAFIPALFEHMSSTSSDDPSTTNSPPPPPSINYIQAETDQDNLASQNVLLKCGFQFIERLVGAFDSPVLGVRDTVVYRIARPGTKLLVGKDEEDGGFVPPVQ